MSRSGRRKQKANMDAVPAEIESRPEYRVDTAHPLGGCAPASPAPELAAQVVEQATSNERLQLQIGQLAVQMRQRQGDLDHRESHLNARIAQVDQDVRATRLWIEEQESLLAQRHQELAAKEKELDCRLERLAVVDAALLRKTQELIEVEESLAQREAAVELRAQLIAEQIAQHETNLRDFHEERECVEAALLDQQQRVDSQHEESLAAARDALAEVERNRAAVDAELEELRQAARQSGSDESMREEFRRAEETLQKRWQELELAEARLAAAQDETRELRESLLKKQQEQEETLRADRLQLALESRRLTAEIEEKRQTIERRSEHLDQSRTSLAQMRAELGQVQQETLEIRLATEELWAQLAGEAPPAALIESLAQTRAKLAKHYRAVQDDIEQKKNEMLTIRTELIQEHRRLAKRKHHFDEWAERRQQENEELARRLVAREKVFHRREAQMTDQIHGWEIERIEYQQAIRRLVALVGDPDEALAVA